MDILKFIICFIVTVLISLGFNALAADSLNPELWHPQAVFISVLYSTFILFFYFFILIYKINYNEFDTDEEQDYGRKI